MLHHMLRAAAGNRATIPRDGLILEWTMDSVSGSTVTDTEGTYDGTVNGSVTFSAGAVGDGANFTTATGQNIQTPDAAGLRLATFSICFWIKADLTVDTNTVIVEKDGNTGWSVQTSGAQIESGGVAGRIMLVAGGGSKTAYTTTQINDDAWHHVVLINNGSSDKCYVDGVDVSNSSTDGSPTYSTGPFVVGERVGGIAPFPGSVDQIRYYNRAITPAEVTQLFEEGS